MIVEYHRPKSVNEALTLLAREQPVSYPLAGGTVINRAMEAPIALVDLQALSLDKIARKGNLLQVGSMVTLQKLLDFEGLPEDLYKVITLEATYNLRQLATIGGTLVTANGRTPLVTIMMAGNVEIELEQLGKKPERVKLGDWLPLRHQSMPGKLITSISLPLNIKLAYEFIARTPADQPIVCAAVGQWESGRTRLALGGWGSAPILAMDGPNPDGIETAAHDAYSTAEDEWASAEYRSEMAGVLSRRCLERLSLI